MLVHEPTSRFGPALRLPRRSCAESAAFEVSRLNLGSTPVHLGDPVQWVNQPMVHLVNRSMPVKAACSGLHRSLRILRKTKLRLLSASILRVAVREEVGIPDFMGEARSPTVTYGLRVAVSDIGCRDC
ncbi:hypothetical protein PIB30_022598 [Stylosanthes scabra]|uniref:Uncharacterized protein n=1 Tax=Stylosanthes scabra TaxID=79078 RepID=A0ABU6R9G9_9FABA|nr:hypothetical protein [Stylosanthes scabra]